MVAHITVQAEVLQAFCIEAFEALKVPTSDAEIAASNLVEAELRGLASHGVMRLEAYLSKLQQGGFNPNPDIRTVTDGVSVSVIDGDDGLGAVIGTRAMAVCLEKARSTGIGCTTVRRGNHFGIAAFYSMMALEHNMIGISICNSTPKVAIYGSIAPVVGTNPLSIAVPAGRHYPLVFDAATSLLARGKILMAKTEGKSLIPGAALDKHGNPTTDPQKVLQGGVQLPFGGHKGSGIALMLEVLSAMLSGALYGIHIPELFSDFSSKQGVGFFFAALNIAQFIDVGTFMARIDQMIDELKIAQKTPGTEAIYMPGELEFLAREQHLREGISIGSEVFASLLRIRNMFKLHHNPESWQGTRARSST
jgi:LDH2 family malate/lactate/ureidoglycolate dehydrogenase